VTKTFYIEPEPEPRAVARRIGAVRSIAYTIEEYGLEETIKAVYAVTGLKAQKRDSP
jgi:hypothetical protein